MGGDRFPIKRYRPTGAVYRRLCSDLRGLHAHYQNSWFRVDYLFTKPLIGDPTHGARGTIDWRLPTGTLQLKLGYQEGVFGSIGYRLRLP